MSSQPQPLNDLVSKIRSKYPGAYDDMDDATLTKSVLAKYPEYSDLAAPKLPVPQPGALNPAFNPSDNAMALAAGQSKTPSGFPVMRGETGSLGPTEAAKTTGEAALQTASGMIPGPATGEAITAGANAGARALTPHVVRMGQWAAEHPVAAKALYTVVKDSALGGGALLLLKKGLDIGLAGK